VPDRLFVVLTFGVLLLTDSLSSREPACHQLLARPPIAGESIGIVHGPEIGREVIEEAIALWRSCPNYRADFPALVLGEAAATLFVALEPGNSGSKRCGSFSGRSITLYRWARTSDRSIRSCGSLALNLAHELGHALGLPDAADASGCATRIMADLEAGNLFERAVAAEECRLAGERWRTLAELALPADPGTETAQPDRPAETDRAERALRLERRP